MRVKDGYGAEAGKKRLGEQLWLHYYNRVLFEKGMISEEERNRMSNRIDARQPELEGSSID